MKKSLLFRKGGGSFCKIYLLVCLFLVGFMNLNAQNIPNKKVSLDLKNVPLIDVLLDIQKQTGVNFAYEKIGILRMKCRWTYGSGRVLSVVHSTTVM